MNESGFTREFYLGKKYNTQNAPSMALACEVAHGGWNTNVIICGHVN